MPNFSRLAPHIPSPCTAKSVIELMENIWDGPLHQTLYDDWHDADKVLTAIGAKWYSRGAKGYYYSLPNGEKIKTFDSGAAISLVRRKIASPT